jgi:hypothetical protein
MPKNEGALGAGDQEMSAAARMHGEPLMKLNRLTRFYVTSAFVALLLIPVAITLNVYQLLPIPVSTPDTVYVVANLLTAGLLLFAGGISIKFLPSSMGGNPHVYSLSMALWSYWFIVVGALLGVVFPLMDQVVSAEILPWTRLTGGAYALLTLIGAGLLLYNLSKTMEQRV